MTSYNQLPTRRLLLNAMKPQQIRELIKFVRYASSNI